MIVPPKRNLETLTVPGGPTAATTGLPRKHDSRPTSIADQSQSEGKLDYPKVTSNKATGKTPGLKREHSDIFKSFSKSSPKLVRQGTGSSVEVNPAAKVPQSVSVLGQSTLEIIAP